MIDLNRICEMHGLSKTEMGKRLWPNNKNPHHAFWHHHKNNLELTETQISVIAEITGKSFEELKSENWKSNQPQNKIIRFEKSGFKVQLCLSDHSTRIVDFKGRTHEVTLSDKSTKLSEYFNKLDQLLETIENSYQVKTL